ncbi:hypothetical protein BD560DRAFT_398609 [Blakeslea trispora]|nr:hypothetical protein BD560DRAFT_398609 [Blakeslea trispora]
MTSEENEDQLMFNNGALDWSSQHHNMMDYTANLAPLEIPPNDLVASMAPLSDTLQPISTHTPLPTVNTTNPAMSAPILLEPGKQYHPEWGVIKDYEFHPLTLKHQRDLEILYSNGSAITDFYFWQANLGGYCMADMVQGTIVSSEGPFVLERKMVEGAPHPGRRKKKHGLG